MAFTNNAERGVKRSRFRKALSLLTVGLLVATGFVSLSNVAMSTTAKAESNPPTTTIRQDQTFYAYTNAGENLDILFQNLSQDNFGTSIRVTSPAGEIQECNVPIGAPANTNCGFTDLTSPTAGIWTIEFNRPPGATTAYTWSIDAQNGSTDIPGRVWSDFYLMQNATFTDVNLWYVGSSGHQYAATYNDYVGIDSAFYANQFGNVEGGTCVSAYRSGEPLISTEVVEGRNCGVPYHVFFEPPAADLPASAVDGTGATRFVAPPVTNPSVTDFAFNSAGTSTRGGTFTFDVTNHVGNADLLIDANGDGDYDDPEDRVIPFSVLNEGGQSVEFDGLDGQGNPINPATQINATVQISQAGEIHFVNNDVESRGGIQVTALNGDAAGSSTLYWDDSQLSVGNHSCIPPVLDGTAGYDSTGGVHGWPCNPVTNPNDGVNGPWGDVRIIDDWTYNPVNVAVSLLVEPAAPNYTVTKSSDPASGSDVMPGDVITYTIDVTQVGNVAATDATLTDDLTSVLDDAEYNGDVEASTGAVNLEGSTLSWSGDLEIGATATITYSVTVKSVAELAAEGDYSIGNVVTSPGCSDACSTEHQVGAYAVTKTANPASGTAVTDGDTITYTVTVTQIGEAPFTGASLTDDLSEVLDDATWNGDLVASSGSASFDDETNELAWNGDLAVGDVITITYSVTVTGEGDTSLTNTVASEGCSDQCSTNHVYGDYSVVKTSDPAPGSSVAEGEVITYTLTVTQAGSGGVAGANLTDDLSEVLDDATWNGDLAASAGEATFDEATNELTWGSDLAVGDVVTITYSVTVTGAGDGALSNVVSSPGCSTECSTDHVFGTYSVIKESDPASGSSVTNGDVITYTLTVTQEGPGTVSGAELTDDLTEVLDDASWNNNLAASAGDASFDAESNELSWDGDLAVGDVVTITYSVTVTGAGDTTLTNVVTSPGCDEDCSTEHVYGGYGVVKSSDPASGSNVAEGDVITYTVTVTQRGAGAVSGAELTDDLTEVLDDASWNNNLAASAGDASFDAESNELSWDGDLAVGDVVTITYSVTVTGAGDTTLTNVVTSPGCDDDCSTEHRYGDYTVVKTSDPASGTTVAVGQTIEYTLTVTQSGAGGVSASLTDDLSAVLDDATYNADVAADLGTVAVEGSTLNWTGNLEPGSVATITYSVTVTGSGNQSLNNVVTSPGCVDQCATEHQVGSYTFEKSSDPASGARVEVGDKVTYTITVNHTGVGAVTGASLTDDLSDVLDDAAWNDDAVATSGTVSRDGSKLSWAGDLSAGQSVKITYSVTVNGQGNSDIMNVVTTDNPQGSCAPSGDCATNHSVPPLPTLPITGSGTAGILAVGGMLTALGIVLAIAARRRKLEVTM